MSVRSILGSLLLTINLLTLNQARSQAIFERGFGTPEDDEAYALCKTTGGGYAVAGYTRFYSPSLISKPFIVKFDQNGQFVWSAYIPVAQNFIATGIAEDASGNLLLCASPAATSSVDSILVAKLTSAGSLIWSQTYGGTGDRTANEIWVTPAGNILVAGSQMQSSPSKRNAFILNINAGGNLISEKVYSSFGNNSFNDLIPTYDGNAVFCSVARNSNDHYAYLVKTDTNGDSLWTRNIFILNNSSSSALEVNAITELSTHELVIGGSRYTGATYNKAFFLQLDETASAIINTAGTGISFSLADGILDMSTGSVLTDEVYGANFYQNFGYHFALLVYDSQNYNVSANFQYLNLSAYSFAFNYSIRGPARAIINDTDAPISLDNNVIAGSTRLSGYGKLDFALVKTDESFSSINNNPPGISYHTSNTICPGDSTLITLDVEKKDFHHWANLKGSGAVFDLGVYGDSLWVYNEGLYACIAFDADSNIFVSNIITITSPDTTVTISQTGSSNFCAAAGGSVLFTATTQITAPAYQWYLNGTPINGATSSTLTATQSGTYYCQVSSGCGISTSNSIAVNANTPPSPGVFMNATIILSSCSGTIGFNQQPNVQYRWYDGSGNMLPYNSPTITPLNPGNYYGVAYNVCGTDSVTFYATQWLYPYPANNSPIINNCNGFPIDLQIQSSFIGIGPTSISWEYNGVPIPGANGINYSATQPGNYSVTFEDPLCPGSINYQYCTIVSPAPIPPFTTTVSNLAICEGDTVDIQAPLIPGVDYQWLLNSINFNPPDSLHLQTITPGNYMLTLFNGCTTVYQSNSSILFSDSIFVDIVQPTGCAATCSVPLGGAFSGGTPLFSFLWSTGQTTQNITNLCNGSYTLTVTDGYGCSGTDTYIINQVPLVVDSTVVDPVCGYCNGSVTLSVISGNGPYSFSWGIGGTSQSLNGLCEGNTWSGTVIDSYNCIQSFNGSFTTSCDSVWPGDADDNGIVENLDLFPIGLHYGTNGPVRNNASLLWVGQPAPLWGMFQANGNDLKYADTDGNGTINDNDTLAIGVNFNQTHSPFAPPQSIDPDITAVFSNDTVYTGQPIQIQLMLGSSSNVIQDLYGVAYTITYDNPLTQPSGVYLDQDGWLISNNNGLELTQGNSTTANVFASMIRTTQTDTSGSGPLATYGCLAALTLPPGSVNYAIYNFSITDIRIIDHNGNISSLNSLDTSLVITDIPTGLSVETPLIQGIYPNPSSGEVMISMIENGEVRLTDNAGRILQVYHLEKGMNRIQLSSYANGMYYFQSASGNKPVKVLLTR